MHADTYSSSQDLLHKYDVILEDHHPTDLLPTCKLANKFCNFRECSRQTELYFSALSLKLYIGSSKTKTLKICLWNLSYVKQACKHMHACVCAQWESTSGHCRHTHCLPTAAVVSKHFWLYILILEIAKSLFIYQFIEDLEICLPLEISVMWSTHKHMHLYVMENQQVVMPTLLYAVENQWVIVMPTASSCLLQQLQSKKNCSLYPPTCDCNKFLSECREVYPLNIYLSDLLKSQLCCWKMHNTKCAIEVESITSINKLLTHCCKQASSFEVP
jgi:hypothetical protein